MLILITNFLKNSEILNEIQAVLAYVPQTRDLIFDFRFFDENARAHRGEQVIELLNFRKHGTFLICPFSYCIQTSILLSTCGMRCRDGFYLNHRPQPVDLQQLTVTL